MAELQVKLEGFEELEKRLRGFPERLRNNYMPGGMRALVATLQKGARRRVPSRTGALRRSIAISTRVNPDGVIGKVYTGAAIGAGKLKGRDAWYGHIIERGAKPHTITPKTKKGLAFRGRVVQSVKHPGIRGRYFMRDTEQQDFPAASQKFGTYVEVRSKDYIEGR